MTSVSDVMLAIPVGDVFLLHWGEHNYAMRQRLSGDWIGCVVDVSGNRADGAGPSGAHNWAKDSTITAIRLTKQAQAARLMLMHMGQGKRAVAPPLPHEIEENTDAGGRQKTPSRRSVEAAAESASEPECCRDDRHT